MIIPPTKQQINMSKSQRAYLRSTLSLVANMKPAAELMCQQNLPDRLGGRCRRDG